MRLTMLGTGNAMVTQCYNTCFVIENEGKYLLVDGGGGIGLLRQLKDAKIRWQDLREIFVTHRHIDHLLGIIWMLRMICQHMREGSYTGEAAVYAHAEVIVLLRELAERLLQKKELEFIDTRLHFVTVGDGEKRNIIGRNVTFFDIGSTKAKQFGFCMELDDGEKLTCCGDEPYQPCQKVYAEHAKWLLHEAFCLSSQADIFKPYEKHHSTARDACELAEQLGVKNLVLYHTEDRNIADRKALYTADGAPYFRGNIFVPDDLETIEL